MKKILILLLSIATACSVLAANQIVGDYGGSMSVSPTGAAVYSIPIECPKGVNGMEPTISLVYNSQSGIGNAGRGWNLSATSVITKVNAVPFYDNKLLSLNYDKSADYLALDGQRLIKANTISSTEVEFRTENDNYNRIIRKGSAGSFYFEVYTTSGLKMTYRQQPEGASYYDGNLGWYLTRVEDQSGNYMTYEYSVTYSNGNVSSVLLSVIRYGANSVQGTSHTQKVEFSYDAFLSYPVEYYSAGFCKTAYQIVSEIRTYAGTSTLNSKYQLTYKTDAKSNRLLAKVKKIGNNGDYLKDLEIEWNEPADKLTEDICPATCVDGSCLLSGNSQDRNYDRQWFLCDYNQDGYPDLVSYCVSVASNGLVSYARPNFQFYKNVYNPSTKKNTYTPDFIHAETKYKLLNQNNRSDGYGTTLTCCFTKRQTPNIIFTKITNDGTKLILLDVENIQNSEAIVVPLVEKHSDVPLCSTGDLNNDGYADIVIVERVGKNGSYSVKILWGANYSKLASYDLSSKMSSFLVNSTSSIQRMVVADMDKDGLLDIVAVAEKGYMVLKNKGNASGYGNVTFTNLGLKTDMSYRFNEKRSFICGDFNGDGICDFFKGSGDSGTNTLYLGKGDCTFKAITTMNIQSCPANAFAFGADIDGDGKTELAIVRDGGKDIYWYRYSGTIFSQYSANHSDNRKLTPAEMIAGDVNGDGRAEIITIGASNIAGGYGANAIYTTRQANAYNMGLVKRIVSPSQTYQINYSNLYDKEVYDKSSQFAESTNLMALKIPLCVVKSYFAKNADYFCRYENLIDQTTGKGLLGFKKTVLEISDDNTDMEIHSYYTLNTSKAILYPWYTEKRNYEDDAVLEKETYTYSLSTFGTNSRGYRLQLTKKQTDDLLNNTSCVTTYSSYSNGQPTVTSVDYGANVKSKVEYKDLVANSTYNIFLPQTKVETQSNGSGSVSRTSKYTYDGKFRLIKSIELYGTDKAVTTTNSYTMKGNLSYSQLSASGCETQTTSYDYTGSGRFVSKKVTPDGVTTIYSWNDALGRLNKETTSVGSLSYVTTYNTYDGFNNCLKKTLPDGRISTTTISYDDGRSPAACLYNVKTTLTGSPERIEMFDFNGKNTRVTTTYSDGTSRSDLRQYDNTGRLVIDYYPVTGVGSPTGNRYYVRNTYDDYGRVVMEERMDGTTKYKYEPLKTTITSPMGTKVLEYNKAGQLIKCTENGQSVTFTYTPAGQVATSTAVSSSGNLTTTMTYDIAGNRISITDPDVGTIQNGYDAYGRKIRTVTETGREILSTYDSRGRLQSVKDGIDNAVYTYNNNNQLEKEQSNHYKGVYTYDAFNRVTEKTETVANVGYKTQYTYPNNYGDVSKITYPSGLVVNNTYNDNGYLTSVSCAGKTIWSGLKLDGHGRISEETLAGSVVKKYVYGGNGYVSKESAYKGTTGLMDLTYTYSGVNITKKTDALDGNTEQYTYDALNRLSSVSATKSGATLTGTHTYDALGNMTKTWDSYWKSISYGGNNLPPHQVNSISYTSSSITGKPTVTFDSYRMATKIEQGNYTYNLYYGPDHRCHRSELYKSGQVVNRKYYLGSYEKEVYANGVNREIHYLYGGNGLAAIYVKTAGKDTLFAAVTDRQNSLTAVMDVATSKIEKFSYKPWGMRRNPANWSENVVTDYPARFSRGYCMHEHFSQLGLINMGGRIFNERTNQFLCADPYRQAPESWLNCNRFGYCMNNPVMYTDPDGEVWWIPVLIGALIGSYSGGVMANDGQKNPFKWDYSSGKTWGYMAGGAVAGGVSGFLGGAVAASGAPFANTCSIMASSFTNSVLTNLYTGGQAPVSINFGFGTYDFTHNSFGFLGKKGNSALENVGYAFGTMANVCDALAGLHPGEVDLQTENTSSATQGKDLIGHSQLVDKEGNSLVDFGPGKGGDFYKFNQGRNNWTEYATGGRVTQVKDLNGNLFNKGISIKGVNLSRVTSISNKLNQEPGFYNFMLRSCSSVAARTLTASGVPMFGLHPYLLHFQANLWNIGVRPWSFNDCFFIK